MARFVSMLVGFRLFSLAKRELNQSKTRVVLVSTIGVVTIMFVEKCRFVSLFQSTCNHWLVPGPRNELLLVPSRLSCL